MLPVAIHTPVEHRRPEPLRRLYAHLRLAVQHRHGTRAPGRDILKHGVKTRKGVRAATHRDLRKSVGTFRRWLRSTRATTVGAPVAMASSAQPVTSTAGLPACAAESGTNYSTGAANTNPSSGATGRWQEMPMHRQPGGLCYGLSLTPAGQDACAVRIFKAQGAGAWVGCS